MSKRKILLSGWLSLAFGLGGWYFAWLGGVAHRLPNAALGSLGCWFIALIFGVAWIWGRMQERKARLVADAVAARLGNVRA